MNGYSDSGRVDPLDIEVDDDLTTQRLPLKLRLERLNHFARLRQEIFDRYFDRRPILERYDDRSWEIHGHVVSGSAETTDGLCFVFRKTDTDLGRRCISEKVYRPVLFRVGEIAEGLRPTDSVVRLQRLDSCHMGFVHSVQERCPSAQEALTRVFDREFGALDRLSDVEFCESIDEVVERGPEVVNDFPDADSEQWGWLGREDGVESVALDFYEAGSLIRLYISRGKPLELFHVLPCPVQSSVDVKQTRGELRKLVVEMRLRHSAERMELLALLGPDKALKYLARET